MQDSATSATKHIVPKTLTEKLFPELEYTWFYDLY